MPNQSSLRECVKCKEFKTRESFSPNKRRSDGLQSYCKSCYGAIHRAFSKTDARKSWLKEWSKNERRRQYVKSYYYKSDRDKRNARNAVHDAVEQGKLFKPQNCSRCINPSPQAHHHNGYSREFWLDVVWLCSECHRLADMEQARQNSEKSSMLWSWPE